MIASVFSISLPSYPIYSNYSVHVYRPDAPISRLAQARSFKLWMDILFGLTITPRQIAPTRVSLKTKRWRIIFQPRWRATRFKAKT